MGQNSDTCRASVTTKALSIIRGASYRRGQAASRVIDTRRRSFGGNTRRRSFAAGQNGGAGGESRERHMVGNIKMSGSEMQRIGDNPVSAMLADGLLEESFQGALLDSCFMDKDVRLPRIRKDSLILQMTNPTIGTAPRTRKNSSASASSPRTLGTPRQFSSTSVSLLFASAKTSRITEGAFEDTTGGDSRPETAASSEADDDELEPHHVGWAHAFRLVWNAIVHWVSAEPLNSIDAIGLLSSTAFLSDILLDPTFEPCTAKTCTSYPGSPERQRMGYERSSWLAITMIPMLLRTIRSLQRNQVRCLGA